MIPNQHRCEMKSYDKLNAEMDVIERYIIEAKKMR